MSDLIDRQAAIDAILHNQEVYSNNFGDDPIDKYTVAIIANDVESIVQLPSAQPVIRCKDCVHRYVDGENVRFNVCELNHNKVQSDEWFCADGERRTDEGS